MTTEDVTIENIEVELIIEAIHQKYDYDFRGYSRASVKRRLKKAKEQGRNRVLEYLS